MSRTWRGTATPRTGARDGSVPEQRYTEAGGEHFVQENAMCFFDEKPRELDPHPLFEAVELEKIELAFMSEKPPNDGHKKNIIKPVHNRLGIGLAKPVGLRTTVHGAGVRRRLRQLRRHAARSAKAADAEDRGRDPRPGRVRRRRGRADRADASRSAPEQLNTTSTYKVPEPYVLYFPAGFKTPKPVT